MAPLAAISVTLLSFLFLAQGALGQTCYYPDGSSDSSHIACSSGGTSVCCAEGFECLSNGLCSDPRYKNYERILRGGCTDKNWGSGCPQKCTSLWPKGDESVHLCSSGKYCCGRSDDCCNGDSEFYDFGSPQVIAIAGKTQAQAASPPEEKDDPQPTTKAQQQDTKSSEKQQEQQQTKASSQPTKAQEQSTPQETQDNPDSEGSQGSQDQNAKSSSAGQLNEPAATNSPSDPSKTDSSGGDAVIANSAQGSPSDASQTGTRSASPSDSPNTASPENPITTNIINNITNTTISPPSSPNNTVAIAVGVGVGVGVLIFLLAFAGCWYVRRKRRGPSLRSQNIFEIGDGSAPAELAGEKRRTSRNPFGRGSGAVYEMDGGTKGVELSATRVVGEVHGESVENVESTGREKEKKWPSMFRSG